MNALAQPCGREILLVSHPGRAEIIETAHRVANILGGAGICQPAKSQQHAKQQKKDETDGKKDAQD